MNCVTDSICGAGALLDWIQSTVSAIDYLGTLAFGSDWRALGPEIAYHAEVIGSLLGDWFDRPSSGCQLYASLGEVNA